MEIDWSGQIEAVHINGETIPITVISIGLPPPQAYAIISMRGVTYGATEDGRFAALGYRLRNVQPTTDPLKDRMIALIRDLAGEPQGGEVWERNKEFCAYTDRAQEIIAEIDGPKSDEEWAQRLLKEDNTTINIIRTAIERGRILEREGK